MNDYFSNLQSAMVHIPKPIVDIMSKLVASGYEAYLVGGCIRDMMLGRNPKDYDVATSATPHNVAMLFERVALTGVPYGTVTVLSEDQKVEVTTFRAENQYLDGRRPDKIEFTQSITDDLSRRDFTINAMAYDLIHSKLVDPFGGQTDLENKCIKAVGDPLERFSEDGLRCLRAVRFVSVLGFFIDPRTKAAIKPCIEVFEKVAKERVREELIKILCSGFPQIGLALAYATNLLTSIIPELDPVQFSRSLEAVLLSKIHELDLMLSLLLYPISQKEVRSILKRLTFPNKTVEKVGEILEHLLPPSAVEWTDANIRRWLAGLSVENVIWAVEVSKIVQTVSLRGLGDRVSSILGYNPPLRTNDLRISGSQVMEILGIGPSRVIGEVMSFLMDKVLENPELNTFDALKTVTLGWAKPDEG